MQFTKELCMHIFSGLENYVSLPHKIKNICECLKNNGDYKGNSDCICGNVSINGELSKIIEKIKKCNGERETSADMVSNALIGKEHITSFLKEPNILQILLNKCYMGALKEILKLDKETSICGVKLSDYKGKVENILTHLENIQKSTQFTLNFVSLASTVATICEKIFSIIMKNPSITGTVIPICISLSVTVILISIFYFVNITYDKNY